MVEIRRYEIFEQLFEVFRYHGLIIIVGVRIWVIIQAIIIIGLALDWKPVWLLSYHSLYLLLTFIILLAYKQSAIRWRLLVELWFNTSNSVKGLIFVDNPTFYSNFHRVVTKIGCFGPVSYFLGFDIPKSCIWLLAYDLFHAWDRPQAQIPWLRAWSDKSCLVLTSDTLPPIHIIIVCLHLNIENIISARAQHFFLYRIPIYLLSRADIKIFLFR